MAVVKPWYKQPLLRRAPAGGWDEFDRHYRGGEFLPYYVPRDLMPQVDEEDYPELLRFLLDQNLLVSGEVVPPRTLRAHQRVDNFRVQLMDDRTLAKRALASGDHCVVDGNHRWRGHVVRGTNISIYRIHRPFEEVVDILFRFPKTYAYGDGKVHPEKA